MFHGDRPREFGNLALKIRKKKETSAVKHNGLPKELMQAGAALII